MYSNKHGVYLGVLKYAHFQSFMSMNFKVWHMLFFAYHKRWDVIKLSQKVIHKRMHIHSHAHICTHDFVNNRK